MLILIYCFSQKREVNSLLGDVIKHMTPDRAFEQHYPQVSSVNVAVLLSFSLSMAYSLNKSLVNKSPPTNLWYYLFIYLFIYFFDNDFYYISNIHKYNNTYSIDKLKYYIICQIFGIRLAHRAVSCPHLLKW